MKHVCRYVKLLKQLLFKTRFKKVDQRLGAKWLIHGTKHSYNTRSSSEPFHTNI